jgi:hypothetical protein
MWTASQRRASQRLVREHDEVPAPVHVGDVVVEYRDTAGDS